jgi:L-ascorbate metabolism protein UlaG (beta-lactamase superfamily)
MFDLGLLTMTTTSTLTVRYLGGPSALIDLDGVRILVDPTFDHPLDSVV